MSEIDRRDPRLPKDTDRREERPAARKDEPAVAPGAAKRPRVRSDEEVAERRGGGPKMEDV